MTQEVHLPRGWESANDLLACEAGRAYILSKLDAKSSAIEPEHKFRSNKPMADACSYNVYSDGSLWFINNAEDEVHVDARDWFVDSVLNGSHQAFDGVAWEKYKGCDYLVIDEMDKEMLIHLFGDESAREQFQSAGGYIESDQDSETLPTLEICTNAEWLREFSSIDFNGVPDSDQTDAANDFKSTLDRKLSDLGFEVVNAKGQRGTCHGWNGAQGWKFDLGPVATFDELTQEQVASVETAIEESEQAMRSTWVVQ